MCQLLICNYIMSYKVFYTIFVIAVLVFGSFYIGLATPRQIMTIVMFAVCWKNRIIYLDKYFGLYIIFILGYILAQLFTGYFSEMIRMLLGYYLVSYVAYQSTKLLIYKEGNANLLMSILFFIGIADALISIGQMYQVPYSHEISLLFGTNMLEDIYDAMDERSQDTMMGYTVPGILGAVPNGYFLSAITLLCFYNKKAKLTLINIVLIVFFVYSTFIVQERTALVACVILSLFSLYKFLHSQSEVSVLKKVLVYSILLISIVYVIPDLLDSIMRGDSRYAKGFSLGDERGEISQRAIDYLLLHPMGGINDFSATNHYPHNLFINMFMFGGMLGGIAALLLFFKQLYLLLKIVFSAISPYNVQQFVFVMMFACYTINSLTHNLSIVTGEPTMWLLWGAIIGLQEYKQSKYQKYISIDKYANSNS